MTRRLLKIGFWLVVLTLGIPLALLLILLVFPLILCSLPFRVLDYIAVTRKVKLWRRGQSVTFVARGGSITHITVLPQFTPTILRQLLQKSAGEPAMRLQRVADGLYLNMHPPVGMIDALLNPLLPPIARDCFYGDQVERYETEILPQCVRRFGPIQGLSTAQQWFRRLVFRSVVSLIWYRIGTLLFPESSWRPPQSRDR